MSIPYYTATQISEVVTQNARNLLPFQVPCMHILGKGKVTPIKGGLKINIIHGPFVGFCSPGS
jgi:hypothetical protein